MVRPGQAGSGQFMTEMGLGGEKKTFFSSMNHIPKMLRFRVMQLFCFSVPLHKGSLASSLRFARNDEFNQKYAIQITIFGVSEALKKIYNAMPNIS